MSYDFSRRLGEGSTFTGPMTAGCSDDVVIAVRPETRAVSGLLFFMKACEGCVLRLRLAFPEDCSDLLEAHSVNILCNNLRVIMHLCAVTEERMCLCVRRVRV